jgi:hypothetical protein
MCSSQIGFNLLLLLFLGFGKIANINVHVNHITLWQLTKQKVHVEVPLAALQPKL